MPFTVGQKGEIEVATIAQSRPLALPAGDYSLTFEHGVDSEGMWCVLHFRQTSGEIFPEIVRADPDLAPGTSLVMEASPAG